MAVSKDILKNIPHTPGVYLMLDDAGLVLYVGKARDLRNRLSSYVRADFSAHSKTAVMLVKVHKVETILTHTEKEALILEASLIKKHRPRYNVILRDDKSYPYVKVTLNEIWPRVVMTRRRTKDGARYFGPFSSASDMWVTLKLLNTLFPLRRCREKELKARKRPCLNFQIGRCVAPCVGKISREAYRELVQEVLMVLEGKDRQLLVVLERKMHQAAARFDFEGAALLRDRIAALNKTLEKQIVVASHSLDQDVFGYVRKGTAVAVSIIIVRNGAVNGHEAFFLPGPVGEDEEILGQVLARYYGADRPVPKEILLPFAPLDRELLDDWLADLGGKKKVIKVPQRGYRQKLLKMAAANAVNLLEQEEKKRDSWDFLATALQNKLRLTKRPDYVECLDISNIGGRQSVGALIAYRQGIKEKSCYRYYKIRSIQTPDDYAMMAEMLYRRFRPGKDRNALPDLLVIDGGKGHLQVAVKVLDDLDLLQSIDLISIAKEKKDEGEKIFKPGRKNPLLFNRNDPVLLFTMRVRDEAHRYGITFHRQWRRRKTLSSPLDSIPGVGPARKKMLLKSLGSVKRLEEASLEDLAGVPGIGKELAGLIFRFLHKG